MASTTSSSSSSSLVAEFRLGESRYDQSSFLGRLQHFLDVVDPRTLFVSDAQLQNAVDLLRAFETGNGQKPEGVVDEDLWQAQKIKQVRLWSR